MATVRVVKTTNYTVMSNYHLRDANLSLKAKGLLSIMISLPAEWDYSVDGLVAICSEGITAVKSALAELKEAGYLVVRKLLPNETKTGRIEYEYLVYEIPPEKQDTEKQGVENLPVENLPLNKNTKELNKDYIYTPYNPPTASPTVDCSPAEESAGDTSHAEEVEPKPVRPKKGGRKKRGASDDGKKTYGEHGNVRLTDEELEKLRERYPDDYLGKIEALSGYIWQHHAERRYKDHYRTLLVWLKEDADKPKDRGGGGKTKPLEMSSFDTEEFFEAALAKSYAGMEEKS